MASSSSSTAAGSSSSGKGKMTTTGDDMLDALVEVFPQLNFLTLVEVCMEYKDDIDGAADYIIHNVLPSILDDNNANADEDSHMKGPTSVDDDADSVQSDIANKCAPEEKGLTGENCGCLVVGALNSKPETSSFEDDLSTQDDGSDEENDSLIDEENDSLMGQNSECLVAGALNSKPETSAFEDDLATQDDGLDEENHSLMGENSVCLLAGTLNSKPETSAFEDDLATQDDGLDEENHSLMGENSDCLLASALNSKPETSLFEDDLATQEDELPGMATQSVYPITLESLDNAIADENDKKVTLLSNVTAISQMLEETNLKEEKSKHAVLESTQAGNDILVKVEELKEMTKLAAEENDKVVAAEVFAEQSILASEAHGLQARLSNISEESNNYVLIIDEMRHTLQVRCAAAELETVLAERVKIDKEALARKMLKEQELLVDSTKERSKKLEQQVQENAKLRELLMDRGQVVDALQGEMLGIFDKISQLQLKVQGSSSMSSSANSAVQCKADEPQHSVDESLKLASPRLSSLFKSTDSTVQAHYIVHESQIVDEPQLLANESEPLHHYIVDEPQVPVDEPLHTIDEPLQLASSSSSSSADSIAQLLGRVLDVHFHVDESPQLASERVDVDESPLHPSYSLATSDKLATFKISCSSAVESNSVLDASCHNNFSLDDSWDVVDDEAIYMCAN